MTTPVPPAPLVVVTRPQPQADEWVAQLQARGAQAAALPLLGIEGPADPQPVINAWQQLAQQALAMFVSPTAVVRFFAGRPAGTAWPAQLIAAGTGPGTRRALLQAGVPEAQLCTPTDAAGQFDSEALWSLLAGRLDWRQQSALIVRGEGGRDWLADALRQQGASVHFVEAYRRTVPVPDAAGHALLAQALARPAAHLWLFSSSQAVRHLPALAPTAGWAPSRALATHARIAEAALRLGFGHVQPVAPGPDAVIEALRRPAAAG